MPVDLSEFHELNSRSACCRLIRRVKEGLTPPDFEAFEAALADRSIEGRAIMRWLAKRDLVVPKESLNCHRRGDCSCARS